MHVNDWNEPSRYSEQEGDSPILRITLLGNFELSAGDRSVPDARWRSRKAAHLVKLLALAPDHALHREQLFEALWPDRPSTASNNLRQTIFVARRQLQTLRLDPALLLSSQGDRVRLYPTERLWVDAEAFESAAHDARLSVDPACYWSAIERYTGPLLPEDRYEDWTSARRETLASIYLSLLDDVAQLHEACGEISSAIAALRQITELEPGDEAAHVRLMRIYALSGRRPLALRQYEQLTHALARDLDASPALETQQLFEAIKSGSYPEPDSAQENTASSFEPAISPATVTNLPHALSSFVGRKRDADGVNQIVGDHRLVTLTGPGGSGKTRLALEVGWRVLGEQSIPVWFVELAGLNDPSLIAATIASVLGVRLDSGPDSVTTLVNRLRDQSLLLILDNCEHLIAACAEVVQTLLTNCPDVRVLATSRQALHIHGEHPWLVPPLPLPQPGASLADVADNDAVRLFFDRVQEHRAELSLTAQNASAVATICRLLDGLPLALELAAARAAVLSLPQLADRLDDALGVLAGGRRGPARQQTLRAALDWSFALLDPAEQCFLVRLAVFRGGWTLPAAEAVTGLDALAPPALEMLSRLVEKSLVQVDLTGDEAHYRLLEPVRQYAQQRLDASDDATAVRAQHADYYRQLAEVAESGLNGPEQTAWLSCLDREHDNLRAALDWLLAHEPAAALLMVGYLDHYWELHAYLTEGLAWMEKALASENTASLTRARVLAGAGTLAWRAGDYIAATSFHQESLDIFRSQDDVPGVALALVNLGAQALNLRELDRAHALFAEGLQIAEEIRDVNIQAMALINLGLTTLVQHDYEQAEDYFTDGLAAAERLQNKHYISVAIQNLGEIAHHRGDEERALFLQRQSLQLAIELELHVTTAYCLEELAAIHVQRGQASLAARLLGGSAVIRDRANSPMPDNHRKQVFDPAVACARDRLGDAVFETEWQIGATLPFDKLMAQALGSEQTGDPPAASPND